MALCNVPCLSPHTLLFYTPVSLLSVAIACVVESNVSFVQHINSFWETSRFQNIVFIRPRKQWVAKTITLTLRRVSAYSDYRPLGEPIVYQSPSLNLCAATSRILGVTCIVDEGHNHSTGSLGHFSRRMLPWLSLELFDHAPCDQFFFTRTPKVPLSPWFTFVMQLVVDGRQKLYPEDIDAITAFDEVKINYKREWFRNQVEARYFQQKAWSWLGLHGAPSKYCLYVRQNGRNPENMDSVYRLMVHMYNHVTVLSFNQSFSVYQQAKGFYECKLLVSPHGSHNANIMFMQPGTGFMEMNAYMFYHHTYHSLANLAGLQYLPSRRNIPHNRVVYQQYSSLSDLQCQGITMCRLMSRRGKFFANLTDISNTLYNWCSL